MKKLFFFSLILASVFLSCRKDSFITSENALLAITADTLKFDTVFTTTGSIYQFFKIINENNQKLKLSSIKLMGGSNSAFKINADGYVGPEINNLEIEANDSLYVFVSVTVNPGAPNLPFVIRDSIQVSYNGNNRFLQLEAWGQNAHFFRNKKITGTETWNNDLPYVILGSLVVDTSAVLTINKGCRIYVHADAPLIIDGTLLVNGEKDTVDRVWFRGDRLDEPYKDFPAGWPGIFFRPGSKNNVLNYAVIKNSYQAIALLEPSPNAPVPKLVLYECIIDNAYDAGIIALNSSIRARNCLVSNCGNNIVLAKGGDYQFVHCTVASFSNNFIFHRKPVLLVTDYIRINDVPVSAALDALFHNCIFWGDYGTQEEEVIVDKKGTNFNLLFDNVLWKMQSNPPFGNVSGNVLNQNPQFDSINVSQRYYDFHLRESSPALNQGSNASVFIDLDGKTRPVGMPDLGCYEK